MASSWLKIRQKQLKKKQVYLAFSRQKRVRCDTGQSQGSWRVILLGFRMYLFLAPKEPGIPCFGKKNFNILCGLVRPSSTFTPKEAESAGHSETTEKRPHVVTQLKWKKQNKTTFVSTTIYTGYAIAQTLP